LVAFRAALDILSTRSVLRQAQTLYVDLLFRLTLGYNNLQWSRFVERNRSELVNHAIHTASDAANFYHYAIDLTASLVVGVIMTVALVYQSPPAACGLGIAVVLFYAVHRLLIRKRLQSAASRCEKSLRALQTNITDMFSSGKEIRTYGNQSFFSERIRDHADGVAAATRQVQLLPQVARILADQGVVLLFLFAVIAVQLQHGNIRNLISLLVFYFVLSRRMLPLISQASFLAGHIESSYESVKIVDFELNACFLHRSPPMPPQLPDAGFVLEMDHARFSFDNGTPILRDVNLRLRKAEAIVLRGLTGSGKSSLLNLIAGVFHPSSGVISVDRRHVAYVPQEVPLLDDSIRTNLLFGLSNRSDAELMRALTVANLDHFVRAAPLGLETRVGDNGSLFSGGERQRLGLARAVLRGVTLLLLDEATSALDEATEWQVLENLSATGMAIVLVTHRLQTPTFAHRMFRLERGSLVEESTGCRSIDEQTRSAAMTG
jgi:ABC-type multidrug transport system fused ATPase/permease subunit